MAKHNVRSQGECAFYLFDHARNMFGKSGWSQVGDLCRIVTERAEEGCVCGDKAPSYALSAMVHNARKGVYRKSLSWPYSVIIGSGGPLQPFPPIDRRLLSCGLGQLDGAYGLLRYAVLIDGFLSRQADSAAERDGTPPHRWSKLLSRFAGGQAFTALRRCLRPGAPVTMTLRPSPTGGARAPETANSYHRHIGRGPGAIGVKTALAPQRRRPPGKISPKSRLAKPHGAARHRLSDCRQDRGGATQAKLR
jgi:hypothetical protein